MASTRSAGRGAWRPWILAALVLVAGVATTFAVTTIIIENERTVVRDKAEQAGLQVAQQLETYALPLAGVAHALEAYAIGLDGDLKAGATEQFMGELLDSAPFLRSISLAPGNRIEYIAPLQGNEAALGLDLSTVPEQWEPIIAIIESGEPALIGPFELVQGGTGLAYRRPIVLPGGDYWGLASSVIDADAFLATAATTGGVGPGLIGIRDFDRTEGTDVWGNPAAFAPDAVVATARPLGRTWEIAVLPAPVDPTPAVLVGLSGITASLLLSWVTLVALRLRRRRLELAARLARLSSQAPGMLYQVCVHPDGSMSMQYATDRVTSLFGLTFAEVADDPEVLWARVHPDDLAPLRESLRASVAERRPWNARMRMTTADGQNRWFQTNATLEIDEVGDAVLHGYLADINEEVRAQERLRISASVFDSTRDGVVLMNPGGLIIDVNPGFTRLLGYDLVDVEGTPLQDLSAGITPPTVYQEMQSALERTGSWQGDIIGRRKNGEVGQHAVSITSVLDDTGRLSHYVAVLSALRTPQADLITGLPGRLTVEDRLASAVGRAGSDGSTIALIIVSLDRFRDVNESLGHRIGDQVLREIAGRLRAVVAETETVARLGGDEFAVILSDGVTPETVIGTAAAITDAVREPLNIGNRDVRLTASSGIALFPTDADSTAGLLKAASQAVRAAWAAGRDRYMFFTHDMQEASQERIRITDDLHMAVQRRQLRVTLQPVVDLSTGLTTEAEALIRWIHPELGYISPDRFIPLAEASGQISAIGDWMFGQVVDLASRARAISPTFRISFNLSPGEIDDPRQAHDQRIAMLRARGVPGEALIAEITEGLLLNRGTDTERNLRVYREAGLGLAIDDFGTRYSSLAYLQSLDLDLLKIDQSFVRDLSPGNASHALCVAIIDMAHALGLQVIAEGVETPEQQRLLSEAGCDMAQGFLFAKPLPPEDLLERLRGEREG